MNKLRTTTLALTLLAALAAAPALAADTATVTVGAEVLATCQFAGSATLDFAELNPLTNGEVNAGPASGITVQCSTGTSYTITDDAASNPLNNGIDDIVFTLGYTDTGTAASTTPIDLPISGTIAANSYGEASVGLYSATVTLSFLP